MFWIRFLLFLDLDLPYFFPLSHTIVFLLSSYLSCFFSSFSYRSILHQSYLNPSSLPLLLSSSCCLSSCLLITALLFFGSASTLISTVTILARPECAKLHACLSTQSQNSLILQRPDQPRHFFELNAFGFSQ